MQKQQSSKREDDFGDLSEAVAKLNITKDEEECEKVSNKEQEGEELSSRGPMQGHAVMANTHKSYGVPLMKPNGEYMSQLYQPEPVQYSNGRRRCDFDDEYDFEQPTKFTRPTSFQPQVPNTYQSQFFTNSDPLNNLSHQTQFPAGPFNMQDFFPEMPTSSLTVNNGMSLNGGTVTIPSPGFNVDHFLENVATSSVMPQLTNTTLPDFTSPSFTNIRNGRMSETDSGMESQSEGVGSPWSDQAPSPGSQSAYISPPSVDSGCGQSPQHEMQFGGRVSPPKYQAAPSPSMRATPSPSSGYGSPGMPVFEDSSPGYNFDVEELKDVEEILKHVCEDAARERERKRQQPVNTKQQPPMQIPTIIPNNPQPFPQGQPGLPQMAPQQVALMPVTTTANQPGAIIIIPSMAPIPYNFTPPKPEAKKLRAIRPKLPDQQNKGPTTASPTLTTATSTPGRSGAGRGGGKKPGANKNDTGEDIVLALYLF